MAQMPRHPSRPPSESWCILGLFFLSFFLSLGICSKLRASLRKVRTIYGFGALPDSFGVEGGVWSIGHLEAAS